jgi:two-component system, NarL family, nitrate/nitrite response regulator NarL
MTSVTILEVAGDRTAGGRPADSSVAAPAIRPPMPASSDRRDKAPVSSLRPIRVAVADGQPIFRYGLRKLLEGKPRIELVGEAADGAEAVRLAASERPDVLLLDFSLPPDGMEVLRQIAAAAPSVKIVLMANALEKPQVTTALQFGARGVLQKDAPPALLLRCIERVMVGEYWIGREGVSDLVDTLRTLANEGGAAPSLKRLLTPRELQIVTAVVEGATNKDIAGMLDVREQTVKNHLSAIFDKLGVSNRLELALFAMHHHLL